MKLAVLGGSFNPLHKGHVKMAEAVINELAYDVVLFVPAATPPHKSFNQEITAGQRLEMVKLLCEAEGNGHFQAEPCEIERGGISYTIDTVNYLLEKYKGKIEGKLGLIMGEENASEFTKWKCVDEIAEKCQIIIVPRKAGNDNMDFSEYKNQATGNYKGDFNEAFIPEDFPYDFKKISKPVMTVSSTEIRGKLATQKGVQELIPPCIYKYIMDNNLYKVENGLR